MRSPRAGSAVRAIRVPLDWDRPNGRTIRLALIRHLASKPEERIGTLFINPGGPGDTGVGLVHGDPDGLDAFGGGRFDVVSWDPRGTNASTRVHCFRSQRSESRFWAGVSVPTTNGASERLSAQDRRLAPALRRGQRLASAAHLDRRHRPRPRPPARPDGRGEAHLRRPLLRHLPRPDLRQHVPRPRPGDDAQRHRRRDQVLEGVRGEVAATVRPSDGVFDQFLSLCDSAGPERCALAGGRHTAAERFQRLLARTKRAPIPAPGALPPLSSPQELGYGDLLLSQFPPVRAPRTWPTNAANLVAALRGDGSTLESGASRLRHGRRLGRA